MKLSCNELDSKEIVDIFFQYDEHRERYKEVKSIELTSRFISRRESIGDILKQVEVRCLLVSGTTSYGWYKTSTGTRYVYGHDGELFEQLFQWYINHQKKLREEKLNELGIK